MGDQAKPTIKWGTMSGVFVQWTKDHPASWDLSVMLSDGKISHFMDPDTDNAWMGFQAGWRAQRKITEDALEDLKVSEATLRGEHTSLSDMYAKLLEDQKISLQKADKVAELIALMPEVLAALDATGVNVSLAADIRKALQ